MKKILAVIVAVMMAMTLVMSVSAEEYAGEVPAGSEWWYEVMIHDIIPLENLEGHSTITFGCDCNFAAGYNEGDTWIQRTELTTDPITIDLSTATINNDSKIMLQKGSAGAFTITYTFDGAEAAAPAETPAETEAEAPAAEETPAETPAETETKAPATGLALAVVPAVMALAAVAVSKKH